MTKDGQFEFADVLPKRYGERWTRIHLSPEELKRQLSQSTDPFVALWSRREKPASSSSR